MSVTVWTRPGCGPCAAVQAALRAHGIVPILRDLADATDAQMDAWRARGALSAPVVEYGHRVFGGFDPDALQRLIAHAR